METQVDLIHLHGSGGHPFGIWLTDLMGLEESDLDHPTSFFQVQKDAPVFLIDDQIHSNVETWFDESEHPTLIVMRDPYNYMANRFKMYSDSTGYTHIQRQSTIKKWLSYAKFIDRYDFRYNHAWVSYNDWVSDPEYRISAASSLGLESDGSPELRIPSRSNGSTFDYRVYDGCADKMKVLERWKYYENDKSFRDLFSDEVVEYAKEMFDMERPW